MVTFKFLHPLKGQTEVATQYLNSKSSATWKLYIFVSQGIDNDKLRHLHATLHRQYLAVIGESNPLDHRKGRFPV
jgi:hypothetical protein